MKKDPELEAYYAEASSWEVDRAALAARSAHTAWGLAEAALEGGRDDPRAGELGELLHPRRWDHRSRPSALHQGEAPGRQRGGGAHVLDREHPLHVHHPLDRPAGAPLEPTWVQGRG